MEIAIVRLEFRKHPIKDVKPVPQEFRLERHFSDSPSLPSSDWCRHCRNRNVRARRGRRTRGL